MATIKVESYRKLQQVVATRSHAFVADEPSDVGDGLGPDPYELLRQGYYYGPGALARVDMRIETVWLRPWMTPFMPDTVKQSLGIPLPPAKPDAKS